MHYKPHHLDLGIYVSRAWYRQKVVTLVAFNIEGAFKGVNKRSLTRIS